MAQTEKANGKAKSRITTGRAVAKTTRLEVPAIRYGAVDITVRGTEPLLVHAWGVKSRGEMRDKQMGKPTKKKEPKDPAACYFETMYIIKGDPKRDQPDPEKPVSSKKASAVHGFPAAGFRKAMIRGAKLAGAVMTDARCAFNIKGSEENLVPLSFAEVKIREDMVRVGGGTADLRYRAIYHGWSATLPVRFNSSMMEVDQIVNLLRLAGFSVGVGEHRPERDGVFGCFAVDPKSIKNVEYTEI